MEGVDICLDRVHLFQPCKVISSDFICIDQSELSHQGDLKILPVSNGQGASGSCGYNVISLPDSCVILQEGSSQSDACTIIWGATDVKILVELKQPGIHVFTTLSTEGFRFQGFARVVNQGRV